MTQKMRELGSIGFQKRFYRISEDEKFLKTREINVRFMKERIFGW